MITEKQLEALKKARKMEDGQFTKWPDAKWNEYMDLLSIYYTGLTVDEYLWGYYEYPEVSFSNTFESPLFPETERLINES